MSVDKIIEERGKNYGHPYYHFQATQKMYLPWLKRYTSKGKKTTEEIEICVMHGVYMILDKLARMAENPLHEDNLEDIKGYATTIQMCIEKGRDCYEEQMHAEIQGYTTDEN